MLTRTDTSPSAGMRADFKVDLRLLKSIAPSQPMPLPRNAVLKPTPAYVPRMDQKSSTGKCDRAHF